MEAVEALLVILDKYGLPIVVIIVAGLALGRGILRFGFEVDSREKVTKDNWDKERQELLNQVAYREGLRQEEKVRGDRLELALGSQTAALRDITEVLKDVEREIVRQPARRSRSE